MWNLLECVILLEENSDLSRQQKQQTIKRELILLQEDDLVLYL